MKPINTKDMMTSYEAYKTAERKANFYRECATRWPKDFENSKEALKESKANLNDSMRELTYVLSDVQQRCRARTITSQEILEVLYQVQTKLGISKKAMNGISIESDLNQQRFAKAYDYSAQSTQFIAEYKNGTWRITNIFRDDCHQSDKDKLHINLTDEAKKAILNRISNGIF